MGNAISSCSCSCCSCPFVPLSRLLWPFPHPLSFLLSSPFLLSLCTGIPCRAGMWVHFCNTFFNARDAYKIEASAKRNEYKTRKVHRHSCCRCTSSLLSPLPPLKKLMCAASDGYMHKPLHGGHRKLPGPWCMQAGLAAHLPLPRAVRALVCGGQSGPGSTMQQHGCVIRPRCAARVKVLALRGTQ